MKCTKCVNYNSDETKGIVGDNNTQIFAPAGRGFCQAYAFYLSGQNVTDCGAFKKAGKAKKSKSSKGKKTYKINIK